ncbi:STAS domain-containing protein [Nocardia sienata]|uniref:STAS domain-containing protein n=1 Tax=Nocardia sienata TaxID=248552 RepID=UPI000AF945C9|nr:STAS domain-containing protein [Nocardia sienata]
MKSFSSSVVPPVPASPPPARSPGDQLTFRRLRRGDIVVLAVRGEADAFTLSLWRQKVRDAVDRATTGGGALIVDTTRLGFLSLRTLEALAADAAGYRRDGVEICLVTGNQRLARLAGTDPRTASLPIRSTVVAAVTVLRPRREAAVRTPRRLRAPHITRDQPGVDRPTCPAGDIAPGHGTGFADTAIDAAVPRHR